MNMVKMGFTAASLLLASAQALAFTPPYYVSNSDYTGKATVTFSGGCKVKATFPEAQYGDVYDSMDSYVGWGLVANGEVVVIEEDYQQMSGSKDNVTGKEITTYYEDMVSPITLEYLAVKGGAECDIATLLSSIKSTETYTTEPSKGVEGYVASFPFNGFTQYVTETKGNKTYKKPQKITGKVTFKGSKQLF